MLILADLTVQIESCRVPSVFRRISGVLAERLDGLPIAQT